MDWEKFISQYDLVYEQPPSYWQDGMVLGNGGLGAVFYAPQMLTWAVNKNNVLDARVYEVKKIISPEEAKDMIKKGAGVDTFQREERGSNTPLGIGPKTCCRISMDVGMMSGSYCTTMSEIYSRLCLYDATLRLKIDKHLFHPRVEAFVRKDEDILVIRVKDVSSMVNFTNHIYFCRPEDIELEEPEMVLENNRFILRMKMPEAGYYVAGLSIIPRATNTYRDGILMKIREKYHPPVTGKLEMKKAGRFGVASVGGNFDVFVSVMSSNDCDDPEAEVHAKLDKACRESHEEQKKIHNSHWKAFWQKSFVELGDKALEQVFYHSLYTLGSTYSRAPIPGLLGLCYDAGVEPWQKSPWSGDLHHDLNIQSPFFPVHALNHSELFEPYMQTYESFLPEARRLAKEVWGVTGAHFDMAFNAMGKSMGGGVGTYRFFTGGSYIALMHSLCWKYRRDISQMKERIYPFLKEILEFYLNIMEKGEDGKYHLYPSHAAELDIICADPVQTISMLKICLQTAVAGAEVLKEQDEKLVARWRELLDNLPEYPVGTDWHGRRIVLDGNGIPPNHHVGQAGSLHPVYPCGEHGLHSNPDIIRLYNDTLDSVVDKTAQKIYADDEDFHYQCVWQPFFRAMTALRLGRKEEFLKVYLPILLRAYGKPNGLFSHDSALVAPFEKTEKNLETIPDIPLEDVGEEMPSFEPWFGHCGNASPSPRNKELSIPLVEANADYLTMITEALLQSAGGIIRVFPAWDKDSAFGNLIAEGNIAVSASKKNGKVIYLKLKSRRDEPVDIKVLSPWTGEIETFRLQAQEELVLFEGEVVKDFLDCPHEAVESARPRVLYKSETDILWIGRKKEKNQDDFKREG